MDDDAFFKPFRNLKNSFFSSNDENWDTVQNSNYVSPDGSVRIQSSFRSKSFGFGDSMKQNLDSNDRPEILSGPDRPLSSFEAMSNSMNQRFKDMDKQFESAFKGATNSFTSMEQKLEDAFGARRINPKVLPKVVLVDDSFVEPQIDISFQEEQAELDQSVFYLLCTMAFMLLLLSGILTAMTYYYRKRSRKERPDVLAQEDLDAPPTYHSATQAIVKMTPEGEPLKAGAPPPY